MRRFSFRQVFSQLLIVLLGVSAIWAAGNQSVNPLPTVPPNASTPATIRTWMQQEPPALFSRYLPGPFVYSGGLHSTAAGCTSSSFALEAFTSGGNRVLADADGNSIAINYSTKGCNCTNPGTDTAWVIGSAASGNALGNYSRVTGTNLFVDCTSSSTPDLPADSVALMQVSIVNGAITAVVDLRPRATTGVFAACSYATLTAALAAVPAGQTLLVNCRLPVTANVTVPATATVEFTAAGLFDIASGVTVTWAAGARLVADAHQIFAGAGTAAFNSGAGIQWIYPEWFGADGTGVVDSTVAWAKTLTAAAFVAPIACTGNYALSATSPDAALNINARGMAIIGNIPRPNQGLEKSCYLDLTGTGSMFAISALVGDTSFTLQNVIARDKNDTANIGLDSVGCVACFIENVTFEGFNTGFNSSSGWYLGEARRLRFTNYRTRAFLCAGSVGCYFNEQAFDITATSNQGTVTTAVEIELGGTTSHGIRLHMTVEGVSTVRHITLQDIQGLEATIYTEGGGGGNVVSVARVSGHIGLFMQGNATDNPTLLVSASAPATVGYGQTANLVLTGYILPSSTGAGTETAFVVNVPGGANQKGFLGVDWSGLNVKHAGVVTIADYAVGHYVKNNYHTGGTAAPSINQGRGDDLKGGEWQAHDVVWNANTGAGLLSIDAYINEVAGNPGTWVPAGMWRFAKSSVGSGDTTPSVDGYNFFEITGAGQTITALDDSTNSKIVILKAITGNVILDQGAGFALTGSVDLTLTPGCMVMLIRDGTLFRQVSPAVCP